jgi:hypothetical protein
MLQLVCYWLVEAADTSSILYDKLVFQAVEAESRVE